MNGQTTNSNTSDGTSTVVKEATQGATVVVRSAIKRCDAQDRYVAFAAERVIR